MDFYGSVVAFLFRLELGNGVRPFNFLINFCSFRIFDFFQILPGLFVGNLKDSKDAKQLDLHKITHILAIHDDAKKLFKVNIKFSKY